MTMNYVWLVVVLMCSVHGCKVGFYGPNCSKPCVYPSFGKRCQGVCNCTRNICNIITGCAECPIGYYGQLCIQPCRHPGFGAQCQKTCNCSDENCNHITGCMTIPGPSHMQTTSNSALVCEDGFFGQDCISPCRYPNYGRKCQNGCNCTFNECNHIKGCGYWTDVYEMTTLLENVSEKEETLMNKYQETVIIGSSSLFVFVIITICVNLMVKFNVCKSNTRDKETITKPHIYFSCPVDNVARRLSYTSLEFDENYNPDAYKNTPTSPVDNGTRRISNTSLEFNESYDPSSYENTPNGPVDNTTRRKSCTSLKFNESYDPGVYENTPSSPVDNVDWKISNTSLEFNESYDPDAYENISNSLSWV